MIILHKFSPEVDIRILSKILLGDQQLIQKSHDSRPVTSTNAAPRISLEILLLFRKKMITALALQFFLGISEDFRFKVIWRLPQLFRLNFFNLMPRAHSRRARFTFYN